MIGTNISVIDLVLIGTYVLLMLGVGYWVHRKSPSFEEYLVAGRGMTTPILICTLASTYYGLDVLFGTSELAFNEGVVAFFGYSELSLGVYIVAAFALSRRLRNAKFTSLPEILERHYGKTAGGFGAIASFFYSIPALSLFALADSVRCCSGSMRGWGPRCSGASRFSTRCGADSGRSLSPTRSSSC